MTKKMFTFSLLAIVPLLLAINSHSQDVLINLYQPPPNQWNAVDIWNLTLTNISPESLKVYLYGTVEAQNDGIIFEGTSAVFSLPANYSGRIDPRRLEPADIGYANSGYEEIVLRTGTMPEGIYTICITVKDAETHEELGRGCIIQPIVQISPPELLNPEDESELDEPPPVFVWLPPMPLSGNFSVSYRLKIVELVDGQVPLEAMNANPAWFTEENIPSTSFHLTISAKTFELGKKYAWQVTAINEQTRKKDELGKSEVWSFSFRKEETPPVLRCQELFCDSKNWEFGPSTMNTIYSPNDSTQDNNTLYLNQPLQVRPHKIVLLKASIIYFYWNPLTDCKQCTDRYRDWGNFTEGTVTDPSFSSAGIAPTVNEKLQLINSHDLYWTPVSSSMPAKFDGDLNLQISLPSQTENSSCSDDINFCIRYTITFMDEGVARFCSVVKPYSFNRQHESNSASLHKQEENKSGNTR